MMEIVWIFTGRFQSHAGPVKRPSEISRFDSDRIGPGGARKVTGRVGTGQEVFESHGSL